MAAPTAAPPLSSVPSGRTLGPRRAMPIAGLTTWALCALFLGPFLVYPVARVMWGALVQDGQFNPGLLLLPLRDPLVREAVRNSFFIGLATTIMATLIALPLAYASARLQFWGKTLLTGLLLVPLLLPPLVGAVGLRQMLYLEGPINILLRQWGLIREPIDFLANENPLVAPFFVVLVAALHLYPLIYLNLSAAWANIDPSLEEAAENQGATGWQIFKTVTLPLLLPGYAAGALIVFIFGFTDLGTPLVFQFRQVAAVLIFDARQNPNDPTGYVLAFYLTILAGLIFWISRRYLDGGRIATLARGTTVPRESQARGLALVGVYALFGIVIFLALLPHIGVILTSLAADWTSQLWPEWSLTNFQQIFGDQASDAAASIKISLLCATMSMLIDIVAGFALAYAIVRGKFWGRSFLDTLAMLPLALPGLILAFGLLMTYHSAPFQGGLLDPFVNAIPLLVIAYAVRRLPYALRSVSSGLQQMSVTLEEASLNMGATPLQTVWQITRPLVLANLIAAGLLTFAFAVLEVSDSLVISVDPNTSPIAKEIYQLSIATSGGNYIACALGVVGMGLLTLTFLVANKLIGKQLGSLFRA